MSDLEQKVTKLAESTRASKASGFYREHWGDAREFRELPYVSRADFLRVPLSKRRYKEEKALVKIVHDKGGMFLSEWGFADIGREHYGPLGARPLVYLSDPHEAIEKSLWCYAQGVLPLIGEKDPDIAAFAAERYRIDSLLTDAVALGKLAPHLEKRAEPLESISILGSEFDPRALLSYAPLARHVHLTLALPEVGAFATAELSAKPRYRALPDCLIEHDETLVVSKASLLPTPIIRYRTTLPADAYHVDGAR